MLLVIGGLPGVGKTTVSREVARRTGAAHVRIDALEARLVALGLAERHGVPARWVRLVCGDPAEHRWRVEGRSSDLPGLAYPDWAAVAAREVDAWAEPHAVVDTADGDAVAAVLAYGAGSAGAS